MMMKKICIVFLFSLFFCLALALPTLAVDTDILSFVSPETLSVQLVDGYDYYTIQFNSGLGWDNIRSFFNTDIQGSYYSFDLYNTVAGSYRVFVEDSSGENGSAFYSNSVQYTPAYFWLSYNSSTERLEWNAVPNVLRYNVQYLNGTTWVNYNMVPKEFTWFGVPSDLAGKTVRIAALSNAGFYSYSNVIIAGFDVSWHTMDPDVTDLLPSPETDPGYTITVYPDVEYDPMDVRQFNELLTSGIYYSKLRPYVFIAFGMLAIFLVFSFVVFRMH